jgi:hypothetical protein
MIKLIVNKKLPSRQTHQFQKYKISHELHELTQIWMSYIPRICQRQIKICVILFSESLKLVLIRVIRGKKTGEFALKPS